MLYFGLFPNNLKKYLMSPYNILCLYLNYILFLKFNIFYDLIFFKIYLSFNFFF